MKIALGHTNRKAAQHDDDSWCFTENIEFNLSIIFMTFITVRKLQPFIGGLELEENFYSIQVAAFVEGTM